MPGTVPDVTTHPPAVQAIIEQAAAADELSILLAQAAWTQADPDGTTHLGALFAVTQAGIDDPTLRAAMDSAAHDAEQAISRRRLHVDNQGAVRPRPSDDEVAAPPWVPAALWAAAMASLAAHAPSALEPEHQAALACPWVLALEMQGEIAGLGGAAEQVATVLLREGWVQSVRVLPGIVMGLLG